MRWPIGRIAALVAATKAPLGELARGAGPGSGLASSATTGPRCRAATWSRRATRSCPSMVERDPEWAGWCSVLVNVNDLAAMGAAPIGLLDAVGARDASFAAPGPHRPARAPPTPTGCRCSAGTPSSACRPRSRSPRWAGPPAPCPAAADGPGMEVRLTADLGGGWRPGLHRPAVGLHVDARARGPARDGRRDRAGRPPPARGRQGRLDGRGRRHARACSPRPAGCGAVLDVAAVPRPVGATVGDWLTCFPGFAMLTADAPGAPAPVGGSRHERGVRGATDPATGPGRRAALARRRGHRGRRRGRHRAGQRPDQRREPPVTVRTFAAAAAGFGRDLEETSRRSSSLLERARAAGRRLLALPEACARAATCRRLRRAILTTCPPRCDVDGPEIRRLVALAGDMVVTVGYCEAGTRRRAPPVQQRASA